MLDAKILLSYHHILGHLRFFELIFLKSLLCCGPSSLIYIWKNEIIISFSWIIHLIHLMRKVIRDSDDQRTLRIKELKSEVFVV